MYVWMLFIYFILFWFYLISKICFDYSGALLVKNKSADVLKKTYFGGGTVGVSSPTECTHINRSSLSDRLVYVNDLWSYSFLQVSIWTWTIILCGSYHHKMTWLFLRKIKKINWNYILSTLTLPEKFKKVNSKFEIFFVPVIPTMVSWL